MIVMGYDCDVQPTHDHAPLQKTWSQHVYTVVIERQSQCEKSTNSWQGWGQVQIPSDSPSAQIMYYQLPI